MAHWYSYTVPGVRISPPRVVVLDTPTTHQRGGQAIAVSVNSVTFKVHYQQHFIGELTVARALAPTVIVGDPVCVEVTTAEPPFTVIAVHGTGFIDRGITDQAAAVARGEFWPGFVPAHLGGHD